MNQMRLPKGFTITEITRDRINEGFQFPESAKFSFLIFEPGAGNPIYSKYKKEWENKCFTGCTLEIQQTDDAILDKYKALGVSLHFTSTMTAAELQAAANDVNKDFSPRHQFLSDASGALAKALGIELTILSEPSQEKQDRVYAPQAYLFDKSGNVVWQKPVLDRAHDTAASLLEEITDVVTKISTKTTDALDGLYFLKRARVEGAAVASGANPTPTLGFTK